MHLALLAALLAADATFPPAPALNPFDAKVVDASVAPCDDFYAHVCSKWLKQNAIPADQAVWGTSSSLELWNETVLRDALVQAAQPSPQRSPSQQKLGAYWSSCMDEKALEAAGLEPLKADLAAIAAMKSKADLPRVVARLHAANPGSWTGTNDDNATPAALLGLGPAQDYADATLVVAQLDQGGMGLPGRDFYLEQDAKMKEIRAAYAQHVQRLFQLAGESATDAQAHAAAVLRIETQLARAAMPAVQRRDPKNVYNKRTLAQVEALLPAFDVPAYLAAVGAPPTRHFVVTAPKFFAGLQKTLTAEPLPAWQAYLRWWLLHGNAKYLGKAFQDEHFAFYGKVLAGATEPQPRWRRCVQWADRDLGEALGEAYVSKAFPPEAKKRVQLLVQDLKAALAEDIDQLDWMSPQTKKAAHQKLAAMEDKIGYPDTWRDYSAAKIGPGPLATNVHGATAFELARQLAKIGKPVDKSEWSMTPPTINAYNEPQQNTINFPAGMLQPPFFDVKQDDAVNYGAIGMVIGHEITHGFDDQGRKFDGGGNLRDWWTPQDGKRYDERAACIVKQYSAEVPGLGVKQDGRLTQGEDTSDAGGLRLAFRALEKALQRQGRSLDDKGPDGLTERQRFFAGHAWSWCTNLRPEIARTIVLTNPHSLMELRVDNVDANLPEFAKAFGCKKGQKMVRENACRVW